MGKYKMAARPSKRFKWLRRFVVAFMLYALIGFFVVPAVIKWQMLKRLPGLTKRQAAVAQVKFNPFAFSLTIRGFSLKEPDGQVFSSFDEFYVNFQPVRSLFHWAPVFKDIWLVKPFGQITFLAGGKFNFSNLLGPPPATPPPPSKPGPPPRIFIDHLSVSNGMVAFDDLSRPESFHTEFGPMNFNLTNFTTVRDKDSPYSFIARTDSGESFAWSGYVSANPPASAGIFRLGGLKFAKYSHYSRDYARFEIAGGELDVAADYHYDSTTNALNLQVSNAVVHLTGFELKSPDTGESVIAIPSFSITGAEADVPRQTARIGLIKSSGGSLLVRREKDGSLNLLNLLILPTNAPVNTPAKTESGSNSPPSSPWSAKIDEIAFDNYAFKIQDKQPDKPATINLDQLGFDVKGVSNVTNAPVSASLSLRFQGSGFVGVNGTATLLPPSADLQLNLTNIDVRTIQPYLEQQLKLVLVGGALDLNGRAQYASAESNAPLAAFTGKLALDKFEATDDVLYKDFVKWDSLGVGGIKLAVQPVSLHVDRVKFAGLNTSAVIGPDRRINLQNILRNQISTNTSSHSAAASVPASAAAPPIPPVSLGALVLENTSLHYSDESLEPHCSFDVAELGGSIQGLSSDPTSTTIIDLKGRVDDRSPFSMSGKITDPLSTNRFADVTVVFTNTELTAFTPYSEKYVGRPLNRGKLSFAVHYVIDKMALKAENGFYVDQLTLGPNNDSPDATSLPVNLAIKLLKDRSGRIILDIPVAGRIDDPKFSPWPIIGHVVMNLIIKAATSPFSLLGAAFGGGEEMSFVTFAPAGAELADSETNKLNNLAKALFERPTVDLEINGSVNPDTDRLPMAQLRLEQRLKTIYVQELIAGGKPAASIEQVQLDPNEHERLVRKTYQSTIGTYKPTPVATNAAGEVDTNSLAAKLAALPVIETDEHGATRLMTRGRLKSPAPAKKPTTTAGVSKPSQPAKPMTRAELELADMEDQLVRRVEITNDDFRELMDERAKRVESYLLKTGKVAAERVSIIPPKTMDASFKGADRANLTLD